MNKEDIQIREYVRTIDGYIRKVIHVNEKGSYECLCCGAYYVDKKYKNSLGISAKKIKSHSFNLIDLIEVGDYVNGDRVVNVINEEPCPSGKCIDIDSAKQSIDCTLWEEDIKTIVTREQFKNMEYKVGGDND